MLVGREAFPQPKGPFQPTFIIIIRCFCCEGEVFPMKKGTPCCFCGIWQNQIPSSEIWFCQIPPRKAQKSSQKLQESIFVCMGEISHRKGLPCWMVSIMLKIGRRPCHFLDKKMICLLGEWIVSLPNIIFRLGGRANDFLKSFGQKILRFFAFF